MDAVSDKIREIISTELQIDAERVLPHASLREDLGMDSIAALNILFAAEEAFEISSIDEGEIAKVGTVSEVESLIRRYMRNADS